MGYIVRHKNPKVTTGEWAVDGAGENWTKEQAEAHAARCEFAVRGIPFEIVPEDKKRKYEYGGDNP